MSQQLIDRRPDLKKLRDEGLNIQIVGGFVVAREIPYVAGAGDVRRGILVFAHDGGTAPPPDHTAYFTGAHPCHADGTPMTQIVNSASEIAISDELKTNYYLSAKRFDKTAYPDYYEKIGTYVRTIQGPARQIDPSLTAFNFSAILADEDDDVFVYHDTASSRAEIVEASRKLRLNQVAIIGVGGTGGYILDFVAKTQVREIHLFDGDEFCQHNAFRAPGAASLEEVDARMKKVDYFNGIYSKMRRGIVPHAEPIGPDNIDRLNGIDFAFLCLEAGPEKKLVIDTLIRQGIPFIEVGMGVYIRNGILGGLLRTVAVTAEKSDHVAARIPLSDGGLVNEYDKNIQIAELNALHAALAVIKWKKLFGFYADNRHEHYSTYAVGRNDTNNEDCHDPAE